MGNAEWAPENMTNCMAGPHGVATLQTARRKPRSNLTHSAPSDVRGISLRSQQRRAQRLYPLRHNGINKRIAEARAECLNAVIQRARPRTQPKPFGCVARYGRIENDGDRHHVGMVENL